MVSFKNRNADKLTMTFRIFNTLTRKIEPFKPLNAKEVGMYTCGPTVYDFAHIGNLRTYIFQDVLRRWLEHRGFAVKHVMNITDVDDKTIKRSQSEGITLNELTSKFEKLFFEDLAALRIKEPSVRCRATEHIEDMVKLIEQLISKDFAYVSEDGVYFSIAKFKDYGKLAGLEKSKVKDMKPGQYSRVAADEYEKEELRDFALWKFYKPEDGLVFWETAVGKGRPGWHIECSAMSMKYLGSSFDIHTGGVDLIFPHHQNEIAQSEAATGKRFVKYWVHGEHFLVDGQKMSKSLGNFYTLRDIAERGFSPLALRYFFLSGHYKTQMNFTWDALKTAHETIGKLDDFTSKVKWLIWQLSQGAKPKHKSDGSLELAVKDATQAFEYYMDENLDTGQALASIHEMIGIANKAIDAGKANADELQQVFDLLMAFNKIFDVITPEEVEISDDEAELISERERLRAARKYKEADVLRDTLHKRGLLLEDTPYGARPKRAKA